MSKSEARQQQPCACFYHKRKIIFIYLTDSDKSMPNQSTLLGTALRQQRENKKLLLRQVAAAIEVDTAFISKVERGEKKAGRDQILKLAAFLNINKDHLITLWLCDRVLHVVDNEPLGKQALQFALKNITTEA